jgi:DNA repair protein RecO (recombination protein O)
MRRRVELESGFVLHCYAYRETSLVVEAFVRSRGRVSLLAKGARRPRSALRGMLLSFRPLRLSWSAGSELGLLSSAEWVGGVRQLEGLGLMCGFYMNELLLRLLAREDPHEGLYDCYQQSLVRLAEGEARDAVLRSFERRMLAELGYAPLLDRDAESGSAIEAGRHYAYDPERGPLAVSHGSAPEGLNVSGQTLLDVARDDYTREQTRDEARRLMRALIAHRLGNQTLHTRAVLMELQEL